MAKNEEKVKANGFAKSSVLDVRLGSKYSSENVYKTLTEFSLGKVTEAAT